jgi:hypothetical protein
MAVNHISFDDQTTHGRTLRRGLQQLEEGIENLVDTREALIQMRDGDGSSAAHYAYATPKLGTTSDAQTQALFNELDSALSKLTTDAQVEFVASAINQLLAKLR